MLSLNDCGSAGISTYTIETEVRLLSSTPGFIDMSRPTGEVGHHSAVVRVFDKHERTFGVAVLDLVGRFWGYPSRCYPISAVAAGG